MPPKKRKTSNSSAVNQYVQQKDASHGPKHTKVDLKSPHPNAQQAEDFGIVLRDFYPPEMNNERCQAYNEGTLERPIETLQRAYEATVEQRQKVPSGNAVVHWLKTDLRVQDNRALHMAYQTAHEHNIPLICVYILSPEDLTAHSSSPPRVDLTLRTLHLLKQELAKRNIPLYMETQENRKHIPSRMIELCQRWGANHLFSNLEYEVDELRRDAKLVHLCAEKNIKFEAVHDTCVVPPGKLTNQQGGQFAVYTPWYRAWVAYVKANPESLELSETPGRNAGDVRLHFKELFESKVPPAPEAKQLSDSEKQHFQKMYPEGEHEAIRRLEAFLNDKGRKYDNDRNSLTGETTSILSPYFASGTLSARTAVLKAYEANKRQLDRNNPGYQSWISEVAWRDFYKHVLVHWPFICMNKCFKPQFTNVEWEYDQAQFDAWCEGKTGFPIVDVAMRQLKSSAWMHNRARMVVSSFLSKDLMIDWRRGERFFMEHLIDGDFASNHGGWGYGSSTGIDPMPYFRIFNPLRQSERFDKEGDYIRYWVPELRDIEGNEIHDPYGRGAGDIAQENGYPRPIIDHSESRDRALERYKKALQS